MDFSLLFATKSETFLSPLQSQQPYFLAQPPPPPPPSNLKSNGFDLDNKVSPSILLLIIILAIIFFVSSVLHLLVRFLMRPPHRDPEDFFDNVTALQGQLQQLFHLHDSGVDQSFIDILPVFNYKSIIGLKNPFDCAVCLCEFEPEDKLRLLPKCSHAFHMECIDTWLLSHSTCPLCRASLLPDFSSSPNNNCSPIVLVLESGSDSSREIVSERDTNFGRTSSISVLGANSHPGFGRNHEFGSAHIDVSDKPRGIAKNDADPTLRLDSLGKIVAVKLGKYRNVDDGEGSSSNKNVDSRRCFSMGSFEYVMDENCSLKVPIKTPLRKQASKKPALPLTPGYRAAMSECDCESRREFKFNAFEASNKCVEKQGNANITDANGNENAIVRNGRESFSVSKIWLQEKKEKSNGNVDSSRRAFSFRFPVNWNAVAANDVKKSNSEVQIGRWENVSELGMDEENQSCNSLDSQANPPSFARRTLLWLMGGGGQNKVVHSSFAPNF